MLSLTIHFLVFGAAIVLGSQLDRKSAEPVVIYLNMEMPGGNSGSGVKDIGFQLKKGGASRANRQANNVKPAPVEKVVSLERKSIDRPDEVVMPSAAAVAENDVAGPSVSDGVPTGTSSVGGSSGGSGGGGFGSIGTGGRVGSGGGTGPGTGRVRGIRMFFLNAIWLNITDISGT